MNTQRRLFFGLALAALVLACDAGEEGTVGFDTVDVAKDLPAAEGLDVADVADLTDVDLPPEEVHVDTPDVREAEAGCPEGAETCVPCEADEACAAAFDDLGPCEEAICDEDLAICVRQDLPADSPCPDGDVCNGDEVCREVDGQMTCAASTPLICDDGDACTQDSCDPKDGCVYEQEEGCQSRFWLCALSGDEGAQVECPLIVARAGAKVGAPVGADFRLEWDAARGALTSFVDQVCLGTFCQPRTIPSCQGSTCTWGSLYPSGPSIVSVPQDFAGWTDHGTMLLFHPSDPFRALTSAVLGADGAIADPNATLLVARFRLEQAVSAEDPLHVWMTNAHFSLPAGLSLRLRVQATPSGRALVVY